MNRLIPGEQPGSKRRRQMDSQRRRTWPISPTSRAAESKSAAADIKNPTNARMASFVGFCFALPAAPALYGEGIISKVCVS